MSAVRVSSMKTNGCGSLATTSTSMKGARAEIALVFDRSDRTDNAEIQVLSLTSSPVPRQDSRIAKLRFLESKHECQTSELCF